MHPVTRQKIFDAIAEMADPKSIDAHISQELTASLPQKMLGDKCINIIQIQAVSMSVITATAKIIAAVEADGRTDSLVSGGINLYDELHRYEVSLIDEAMRLSGGKTAGAARLLGIPRPTLYSKVIKFRR